MPKNGRETGIVACYVTVQVDNDLLQFAIRCERDSQNGYFFVKLAFNNCVGYFKYVFISIK